MLKDNGFIFSVENPAFALLSISSFGLYALVLILCWMLLIWPETRKQGRNLLGKLLARGWWLFLPWVFGMIEVRLRYPESMEPLVGAIYLLALFTAAWVTRYFFFLRSPRFRE